MAAAAITDQRRRNCTGRPLGGRPRPASAEFRHHPQDRQRHQLQRLCRARRERRGDHRHGEGKLRRRFLPPTRIGGQATTKSPPSSSTISNRTTAAPCPSCSSARRKRRSICPAAAQMMLKALLKPSGEKPPEYIPVTTDDTVDLGGRTLRFLHTPYLHWPDTQCTYLEEDGILFTGDVFGCHFCDNRLFNDTVGDFRFSFEYYYAHIMRPFREYVLDAIALIEPLRTQADRPGARAHPAPRAARLRASLPRTGDPAPVQRGAQREDAGGLLHLGLRQHARAWPRHWPPAPNACGGVRVSLYDLEGGEVRHLRRSDRGSRWPRLRQPDDQRRRRQADLGSAVVADHASTSRASWAPPSAPTAGAARRCR